MPGVPAGGNPRAVGTAWLACCAPSGRPLCMYRVVRNQSRREGKARCACAFPDTTGVQKRLRTRTRPFSFKMASSSCRPMANCKGASGPILPVLSSQTN